MQLADWLPSRWAAAVIVLAAAGAAVVLPRLSVDTRLERMALDDHEATQRYNEFVEQYGQDDLILIAVSGKNVFDVEALDAMVESMDLLLESDTVASVSGLPQVFMDLYGGEDPEALEEEITSTPFYQGFFISKDRSMAGIVVTAADLSAIDARGKFVDAVRGAIGPLVDYGFKVDLVGSILIGEDLRAMAGHEAKQFFPVAMIVSLLILLALLRSGRGAAVVMVCGAITIVLTLSTIVLGGMSLNVVTQSSPLILWMLTLASCIHVVSRYQHFLGANPDRTRAAKNALREIAVPCFLSAITTSFGFISLTLSHVPPIREFGIVMAVGMIYAVIVNLVLGPYLLMLFRVGMPRFIPQEDGHRFRALGRVVAARPWPIIVVFAGLIVLGMYNFTQVRTERSTLSFLPKDAPAVVSFHHVADSLAGMYTMEILINTPGGWTNPEYWKPIDGLAAEIQQLDHVTRVLTPLDYLRKLRQWDEGGDAEAYALPETQEEADHLIAGVAEEDNAGLKRLVRQDGGQVRMTAILTTADAGDFLALYERINGFLAQLPAPLDGWVTGRATQMQQMQVELVNSQRSSFALAFVLVFASILIGLRSLRMLLVSVVPNLMPILSTFTVLVVLDIPLDAGTVMVASIALGIAVDDTVHILSGFQRHLKDGDTHNEAILGTMGSVGPAITVSSFTMGIGFFILGLSVFKPLSYFGMASGVAIVIALLADLLFVPALLSVFGGKDEPEAAPAPRNA
ncbi:MAG: MMPL family transporter [Candidatus Hydrogenedens sp.]|nr:MMPL family transporter [Candidatus Hydrogenedens sp.]